MLKKHTKTKKSRELSKNSCGTDLIRMMTLRFTTFKGNASRLQLYFLEEKSNIPSKWKKRMFLFATKCQGNAASEEALLGLRCWMKLWK